MTSCPIGQKGHCFLVVGLYQLMLQTFHKILSSKQKVCDGKYVAARRFEVVFGRVTTQCTC